MIRCINQVGLSLSVLIFLACGPAVPELKDVDLTAWKSDREACLGDRTGMAEAIVDQKNKLLGLSEMDVINLLGKPDRNELYSRNQKFYHYFLDPSAQCASPDSIPRMLSLRFNAVGLVQEAAVER